MPESAPSLHRRIADLERKRRALDDELAALKAGLAAGKQDVVSVASASSSSAATTASATETKAKTTATATAATTTTTTTTAFTTITTTTATSTPTKGAVLCVDPNDEVASVLPALAKVPPGASLTGRQTERYSRQMLVPGFGPEAQRRLLSSSVLLVGAGGLGSSAALYLAASGFGRIGIVDDDVVDESNLHRQVIHWESSARAGRRKVGGNGGGGRG